MLNQVMLTIFLLRELKEAGCDRIRYVADAFRKGMSVKDLFEQYRH